MKLFVWVDPYPVSYGSSLLFAVAKNEDEARKIATGQRLNGRVKGWAYGDCSGIKSFDMPLGKPSRVVDLPCAEWHEWSE